MATKKSTQEQKEWGPFRSDEGEITLKVTFSIPKAKIKNANVVQNHIVAAQKSSWIRAHAEPLWAKAVEEQFSLVALEPNMENLPLSEIDEEVQEVLDRLEELRTRLEETEEALRDHESHATRHKENKAALRKLKKASTEEELAERDRLEEAVYDHEEKLATLKASKTRLKATIASVRQRSDKTVGKEMRRLEQEKRRLYVAAKLEANRGRMLFRTCAVKVRVNNIVNRPFDSPNFYATVKPILDAATDTGVVWEDDNNDIIAGGVLFLPGKNLDKNNYVFEVELISKWTW